MPTDPPETHVVAVAHDALTLDDLAGLRALFDQEYSATHGPWDPGLPYGYAPHDVHHLARTEGSVVGHVGWARRVITVGDAEVTVAGVGGVLVAPHERGRGLAQTLMATAAAERWVDREGRVAEAPPGAPLMVLPLRADDETWPAGDVDLHGRAW